MLAMRCVVTGQDPAGHSVVVSDGEVPPIRLALLPGAEFHRAWGSDEPPRLPSGGAPPAQPGYFPPPGGYRFGCFTLAPESMRLPEQLDVTDALAEFQQKLPGMAEVMEVEHAGMHTTDTVDFVVVISGECALELDDGAETLLSAGDCVVQNGTRHAWHSRGDTPCVLFVTLLGATRR
jgi:mannose-6-phosphate isomerase-like protein (cupin superfamily)